MFTSETARSILWLWQNDQSGWRFGSHSVAHPATGVGIWTANDRYGLAAYHDVPRDDAMRGHILNGRKQKLGWFDRMAVYRALGIKAQKSGGPIPRAISEYAAKGDKFLATADLKD